MHGCFIGVISMAEPTKRASYTSRAKLPTALPLQVMQLQGLMEDPSETKTIPLQKDQGLPNQSHMIVFAMTASIIGWRQWLIRSDAGSAPLILESSVQSVSSCLMQNRNCFKIFHTQ